MSDGVLTNVWTTHFVISSISSIAFTLEGSAIASDRQLREPVLGGQGERHILLRDHAELDEHLAHQAAMLFLVVERLLELLAGDEPPLEEHLADPFRDDPFRHVCW